MKRNKLLALIVIGVALSVACYFYGKPQILPNDAVLDSDSITIEGKIELLKPEPNFIRGILDTNNVFTIYDPNITVVWDTTEVKK